MQATPKAQAKKSPQITDQLSHNIADHIPYTIIVTPMRYMNHEGSREELVLIKNTETCYMGLKRIHLSFQVYLRYI